MDRFRNLPEERIVNPDEPTKADIIDSPEFHVGIVSLAEGQEIPPHPEPYAVFFYVLKGTGVFTGGDGSVELSEGDALHLEHGEVRGIRCTDPLTILGVQEAH